MILFGFAEHDAKNVFQLRRTSPNIMPILFGFAKHNPHFFFGFAEHSAKKIFGFAEHNAKQSFFRLH